MTASKQPFSEKSVVTVVITLTGPLIWALHFGIVYAAHHLTCTLLTGNNPAFWAQLAVIAATIVALSALLLTMVKPGIVQRMDSGTIPQDTQSFLTGVMRLLALLSFFGVLWAGSAVFFLPVCESLV